MSDPLLLYRAAGIFDPESVDEQVLQSPDAIEKVDAVCGQIVMSGAFPDAAQFAALTPFQRARLVHAKRQYDAEQILAREEAKTPAGMARLHLMFSGGPAAVTADEGKAEVDGAAEGLLEKIATDFEAAVGGATP